MRRIVALSSVVFLGACLAPAPQAPAPLLLHSAKASTDVTRIAAYALTSVGFRVTQTDEYGEALQAVRTRPGNGNQDYVTCQMPKHAEAAAHRETALTITMATKPASTGSDVTIRSNVRTSYPGYAGPRMAVPSNETDCVSSGEMERQLAEVVR